MIGFDHNVFSTQSYKSDFLQKELLGSHWVQFLALFLIKNQYQKLCYCYKTAMSICMQMTLDHNVIDFVLLAVQQSFNTLQDCFQS